MSAITLDCQQHFYFRWMWHQRNQGALPHLDLVNDNSDRTQKIGWISI